MEIRTDKDFSFDLPKNKSNVIKVMGIGGGGSNAINYMFRQGIVGVDFVVSNTDAQALSESPVPIKIQLGATLTEGLGAGANPEVGARSAEESLEDIRTLLSTQTKMLFITAGMGGGTGTGAAPIIAELAQELGILTVGIVTMPFQFEGKLRLEQAQQGLERLKERVDSLIVINNNKLREVYGNLGFKAGFAKADEVLATAAKGIAEVITHHYTQNIDLKDAKTVLTKSGSAIMGSGTASGNNRAQDAISKALDSPLLNDNKITGCKNVLLLIVSGTEEITIDEIGEINDFIQTEAGNNANIIMGIGEDPSLGHTIAVTIIATGFGVEQQHQIVNTEAKKIIHTLEEEQTAAQVFTPKSDILSPPVVEEAPVIVHHLEEEPLPTEASSAEINVEEENPLIDLNDILADIEVSYEEVKIPETDIYETPVVAEIVEADLNEVILHEETVNEEIINEETNIEEAAFEFRDVSPELADIEVVDAQWLAPEEEQQIALDFDMPLSGDTKETPNVQKQVIGVLSEEQEETKAYTEPVAEEGMQLSVRKEQPIEEPKLEEESLDPAASHQDPFDRSIKSSLTQANANRIEQLKKFNHTFSNSMARLEEMEKQPAYKRQGVNLNHETDKPENSRLSLGSDSNDELQLRINNSFLHDNVD